MAVQVIGVRFREASKIYHFAPPDSPVSIGDYVVVPTARGEEMAHVVTVPEDGEGEIPKDVRPIVRIADQQDRDQSGVMRDRGDQMLRRFRELVLSAGIDLNTVAFQINLAGTDATCHFQSESLVDFRDLVERLEVEFEIRVHMQQVGSRDRAKLVDGYDICGLRLCCSSWMTVFPRVGIKMAKEQQLALNPDKLSGVCGRLLCCLTFEYDVYREMRGTLPKVGKNVSTPAGMGRVIQVDVLRQIATIAMDDSGERVTVPAAEIGLAVRVEEAPNQALIDVEGVAVTRDATPAQQEIPAADAAKETEESSPSRRRRRRRRRRGGGGESGAGVRSAEAAPLKAKLHGGSGIASRADSESHNVGNAGDASGPRRRRGGDGGSGEGGSQSPPASGGD